MKLRAADLDGVALSWAVAQSDPRNEGLRFAVRSGVLCAVFTESDQSEVLCLILPRPGWLSEQRARNTLGRSEAVKAAQTYCPLDRWEQAAHLLETSRIELGPDGDTLWRAKVGERELRAQPSARHALLRAFVLKHGGEELEVPEELASVLCA